MSLPPKLIILQAESIGPRERSSMRMVLDTGATATIIPPETALAIGCDPAHSAKLYPIITASSVAYLPVVTLPALICLGQTVKNFEVICHRLPAESRVQGLLGLDFLRRVSAFQEFEKRIHELTRP